MPFVAGTQTFHGVFCRFHLSVFIHIHTILSVSQFTPILSVFARCVFALSMNVWSFARGRCPSSGRSGPENQHKTNTCFPPCLQQTISIENHVWNQLGCEVQGLGQPGAGTEDALGIVQCTSWNTNNPRNIYIILYIMYTSSTAQGGGGSFKNRKPIGEIGCCESGMAEQIHWWTERCLRSPLFLSLSLTIYPPTNLSSMHLSIYRSIYPSLSLSLFHLITYLSILSCPVLSCPVLSCPVLSCLSVCLSVDLSICGAVSFSVM